MERPYSTFRSYLVWNKQHMESTVCLKINTSLRNGFPSAGVHSPSGMVGWIRQRKCNNNWSLSTCFKYLDFHQFKIVEQWKTNHHYCVWLKTIYNVFASSPSCLNILSKMKLVAFTVTIIIYIFHFFLMRSMYKVYYYYLSLIYGSSTNCSRR